MTDTSNLPAKRMTAITKDTTAELMPLPWRCDVTGNPHGTDTRRIGAPPCQCQGCRAATALEALQAENERLRKAGNFALSHVFDPPEGWYPADVFLSDDRSIEEQLEAGRDKGPVYASKAREMLRAALKGTVP